MRFKALFPAISLCVVGARAGAQSLPALSRAEVIAAAVAHSPRLAAARADTAAAHARIATARSLPDPTLAASYTKDVPQYHVTATVPLDEIWTRGLRTHAAETDAESARLRERYEIATVSLDADTTYTRALAALAHARLSTANAREADSLLQMARARLAAGDASELDVELASLVAGQQANSSAADSVTASTLLLSLQAIIGQGTETVSMSLADTLAPPALLASSASASDPLLIASGRAALASAELTVRLQHRSALGSPGLIFGFDTGDPTGSETGLLPTIGFSLPLPIFNRNRGPIAEAEAARDRADADLQLATVDSRVHVSVARAQVTAASTRITRDRGLLASADRVASLALRAYQEGAVPLASVLEAERSARDVRSQYIDDVATLQVASATLRLLTITSATDIP